MPTGIWTEHTSEAPETKGRLYYFNSLLQQTQWEKPVGQQIARPVESPSGAISQPNNPLAHQRQSSEWQATVDSASGKVYYFNRRTNETSWTNPEDTTLRREQTAQKRKSEASSLEHDSRNVKRRGEQLLADEQIAAQRSDGLLAERLVSAAKKKKESLIQKRKNKGQKTEEGTADLRASYLQQVRNLKHHEGASGGEGGKWLVR